VAAESSTIDAGEAQVTESAEAPAAVVDRSAQAAGVLRELLRLADVPATLDVKDAADGGISIALVLGAELPGVALGRRGTFVDALQFLVNKLTHRPGSERRWVSLGLGEHPAPRLPRPPRGSDGNGAARPPPVVRAAPVAPMAAAAPQETPAPPPRALAPDESVVEVSEDPELTRAARALAEASAQTGRFYGIVALSSEDRARMERAVADVAGVRAVVEGEGRLRRLVFTPDRPTPMPRKTHPLGVDVEEAGGADGPGS
jgi:predicted RNA-binding protein Jag